MPKPTHPEPTLEFARQRFFQYLSSLTGHQDLQGVEIAGLIRRIANAYEIHHERHMAGCDLSGPRLGILMRLEWEELHDNREGVTPTMLSHNQRVSRNTISALLSGLESQGLIERRLDPADRRGFRIRLTEKGRQIVTTHAPRMVEHHNQLVSTLSPEEQTQLIGLLNRLYAGLNSSQVDATPAGDQEG